MFILTWCDHDKLKNMINIMYHSIEISIYDNIESTPVQHVWEIWRMLRKNGKISKATLKRRRPVGKRKIEVIAMNMLLNILIWNEEGGGSKLVHLHIYM